MKLKIGMTRVKLRDLNDGDVVLGTRGEIGFVTWRYTTLHHHKEVKVEWSKFKRWDGGWNLHIEKYTDPEQGFIRFNIKGDD